MAKITTLENMITYCKVMMGAPVINIEMADMQFEQVIEDECNNFSRYCYEEGNYQDYVIIQSSAGVSDYPISGIWDSANGRYLENVQGVYNLNMLDYLDGINLMFSPTHILLHDEWVEKGNYPSRNAGMGTAGLTLTNYDIAMMYLKDINMTFGKAYTVRYIQGKEMLKIVPTPQQPLIAVLSLYRKLDDMYLYNHPIVKRMCTGAAKKLYGNILRKYQGTLPDSLSVNGDAFYSDGVEEYNKAIEDCVKQSAPPDFFVG